MTNSIFVAVYNRSYHLLEDFCRFTFIQALLVGYVIEQFASISVFLDKVDCVLSFKDFIQLYDVGVIEQL